jgi:polar amino acid transport system substrate-binding protein
VQAAPARLFLPLAQPLASARAAIAVRKGDPDFLNFLDTWLAIQRDEGWLDDHALHWSTTTEWLE